MKITENVSLAPRTTFRIGGPARYLIETSSDARIVDAIDFARTQGLPLRVLGAGSNVLVPDEGVEGIVLRLSEGEVSFDADRVLLIAGAGMAWDKAVDFATTHDLYGVENLAGIPGTVGGATVQNIGAYGAEISDVFAYADVIDVTTGTSHRIERADAAFMYRSSIFKHERNLIITRVAFALSSPGELNINYVDLTHARDAGVSFKTPAEVAAAVRAIRSEKFPTTPEEGTAGSFFKNPVLSNEQAALLAAQHPGVPVFPHDDRSAKVSLAWLLDHALALKGHTDGLVRLYERQPLVVVAKRGATATQVDAFAHDVRERVFDAIGITIEREVEMFGK